MIIKKVRTINKLRKHKANKNKKVTKKMQRNQKGGSNKIRDNFEVTNLRNINQDKINSLKISNYINENIDWGIMPGPPPTDCVIM
jgi:hypothetical protein